MSNVNPYDPNNVEQTIEQLNREIQEDLQKIAEDQQKIANDQTEINATRTVIVQHAHHEKGPDGKEETVYTYSVEHQNKYTDTQILALKNDIASLEQDEAALEEQIAELEISAGVLAPYMGGLITHHDHEDNSDFNLILSNLRRLIDNMKSNRPLSMNQIELSLNEDTGVRVKENNEDNSDQVVSESGSVTNSNHSSLIGFASNTSLIGSALPNRLNNERTVTAPPSSLRKSNAAGKRYETSSTAHHLPSNTRAGQIAAHIRQRAEHAVTVLQQIDQESRDSFRILESALQLKPFLEPINGDTSGSFTPAAVAPVLDAAWDVTIDRAKVAVINIIAPTIEHSVQETVGVIINTLQGNSEEMVGTTPLASDPKELSQSVEQIVRLTVEKAIDTAVRKTIFLALQQKNGAVSVDARVIHLTTDKVIAVAAGAAQSAAITATRELIKEIGVVSQKGKLTPVVSKHVTSIGEKAANQSVAIATNSTTEEVATIAVIPDWRQAVSDVRIESTAGASLSQTNHETLVGSKATLPDAKEVFSLGSAQQLFSMLDEIVGAGTLFPIVMEGALRTFVKSASCLQSLSDISGADAIALFANADAIQKIGDAQNKGVLNFLETEIVKDPSQSTLSPRSSSEQHEEVQESETGAAHSLPNGYGRILAV